MQRAAASAPTTPLTGPPSAKRQKLNDATALAERQVLDAALAAEEAKRVEAQGKGGEERGETKWVLSYREEERKSDAGGAGAGTGTGMRKGGLRVERMGYSEIDAETGGGDGDGNGDGEGARRWRPVVVGRRSFGRFNKALEVSGSVSTCFTRRGGLLWGLCSMGRE